MTDRLRRYEGAIMGEKPTREELEAEMQKHRRDTPAAVMVLAPLAGLLLILFGLAVAFAAGSLGGAGAAALAGVIYGG